MSEITKLYENAGFKKQEIEKCTYKNSTPCGHVCDYGEDCPYLEIKEDYPPFTTEKQLELIKWYISSVWWLNLKALDFYIDMNLSFEEKLAKLTNQLWKDMAESQRKQVKGILE